VPRSGKLLEPSNRFATVVLAAGSAVLLVAIGLGERMGDRVLGQATDQKLESVAVVASTEPSPTPGPYGPDWKRSITLSAAGDPRFPDPRVPPQPLPTIPPTPKVVRTVVPATPTPNPNIPIWRQQPLPTATPTRIPEPSPTPAASPSASADRDADTRSPAPP
jgi:hypothetical protein